MRITIEGDESGQVKGAAESAPIDAGPAPIEHVRRMSRVFEPAGGDVASPQGLPDPDAGTPLNPLRAGAAAASRRRQPADAAGVPAADGGPAAHAVAAERGGQGGQASSDAPPGAKAGRRRRIRAQRRAS